MNSTAINEEDASNPSRGKFPFIFDLGDEYLLTREALLHRFASIDLGGRRLG